MSYSIGALQFFDFQMPTGPMQQTALESRPGTDGHSLWLLGIRGSEFKLDTFVDLDDVETVFNAFTSYRSIVGTNVPIVWAGQAMGNFDVLNVQQTEAKAIVLGVGGINTSTGAVLSARWQLIATV